MAAKFITELSGSLIFRNDTTNTTLTPGLNALGVTGSLNVSGSDITLNGTSIISRIASLEAGSGGGASLLGLNTFSGSAKTSIAALNLISGSQQDSIDALNAATSSYITSIPTGTISGSAQIEDLGFVTSSGDNTPAGTISSSAQIEDLGFVTSSGDISAINVFTGSAQTSIDALNAATSSYVTAIPAGTISSSVQINDLGFVTSSVSTLETGSFATTGSNVFKGQQVVSGSLIPEANGENNGIHNLGSLSAPWQDLYLTTASLKFVRNGQLVSTVSGENDAIRVGNILITTSSISVVSGTGDSLAIEKTIVQATVSASGEVEAVEQVTAPEFTVSSSAQITALGFISESGDTSYSGDRIVSNDKLGNLFTDGFNASTTGSITDFLNAVFFPNNPPSFTSATNFTIDEFIVSGSSIGTLTGNDPEGQTLTFDTQSAYTSDFVKVASNGDITITRVPTTEDFNTVDRGDGTLAHPIQVQATDTFNATTTATIYVNVTANSAPVFRQTSISGNVINSFSVNRNENAPAESVGRIYFTDTNSDTITIRSASDANGHFTLNKYSTYIDVVQATGSLDYEDITTYNMSITASDEHYEASQDTDAVVAIPITINVTDNVIPTINNQTLSSINENSSNGATVGSIAASDSESDTITFTNFTLSRLELDNVQVSEGTYSGGSQATDPHENPFQMNSSGVITRKNGVYINSDLINEYQYTVQVTDQYNSTSNQATITIPIDDDTVPTITDNWSAGPYIIESAIDGDQIKINSNGRTGTQARFTADQTVTWTVNPTADFSISSTGYLTVNRNISGSSDTSGDTVNGSVTASNSFGTTNQTTFDVSITVNSAPDIIFANTSANLNTNGARSGSTLTTVTFSDVESNAINHDSFVFSDSSDMNAVKSGDTYYIQPTNNLSSGNHTFSVSIKDIHGFSTNTENHTITIAQAPIGSLSNNGTFYAIESALSGSNIVTNSNGRTGTQGDLSVSYTNVYNGAAVASFTSSNASIAVDNNGGLTLDAHLSGSSFSSGDTINSNITFRDQFNNIGSGSITVNVTENVAPTVTITDNGVNTEGALNGSTIATIAISDSEDDAPYELTLTGTGASSLNAVPQNAASSSWNLISNTDLAAGSYAITASADDSFARTGTATEDLTVTVAADYGKTYIYTSTRTGGGTLSAGSYEGITGITSKNSDTPPAVTGYQSAGPSPFYTLKDGDLGESSITVGGGTMTLRSTQSGSNLGNNISASFAGDGSSSDQILIIAPSGSDLGGIPTSMTDSTGGSTSGEYVLFQKLAGESSFTGASSIIHKITLDSAHEGYTDYFVIGRQSAGTFATAEIRLIASSGSAPS